MYRLLFDFGHGYDTPGKRSPDGRLLEYKYVREIGSAVESHFRSLSIPTEIIVPEEKDITLQERVKRVNDIVTAHSSDQCLLLSIHVNAAGMGKEWMSTRGWCVYTYRYASNASQVLANNFYDAAKELGAKILTPTKTQKYWTSGFYILKNTKCPAILTENFFQDNKEDVDMLLSKEGRTLVENIQIIGLSKYLGLPYAIVTP